MKDLIHITQTQIGAENVNSVDAKEIYNYLEIKTAYTTWIQRAIEKYDFIEGEDFISNLKESNGGRPTKDFIVSIDMAKELCLVENNPKGKETRKYFIAAEKQSQRVLTTAEQIALIAQGHTDVHERLDAVEYKIENDIPLTSAQKHNVKKKVSILVYKLIEDHKLHKDSAPKCYAKVWKKVKDHFIVSSYMEIPKSKFKELNDILDAITISDIV